MSLLRASHPEPAVAVTALAAALARSTGASVGAVTGAFAAGQLATGWSNDWIDAARDRASGRTDKPLVRDELPVRSVGVAALGAVAACVPLSLRLGRSAGSCHLVAVASALAYNAGLKSTWLSWAPYAVSFALVPSVVTLAAPGAAWAPRWATVAGGMLGVGAHLANALPDLDDDARTGVRGLPHRLGAKGSAMSAAALLLTASALLAVGPGRPGRLAVGAVGLAGAVTGGGLALGRRAGSRAPFRAALAVAGLDVALLVARGAELSPG